MCVFFLSLSIRFALFHITGRLGNHGPIQYIYLIAQNDYIPFSLPLLTNQMAKFGMFFSVRGSGKREVKEIRFTKRGKFY